MDTQDLNKKIDNATAAYNRSDGASWSIKETQAVSILAVLQAFLRHASYADEVITHHVNDHVWAKELINDAYTKFTDDKHKYNDNFVEAVQDAFNATRPLDRTAGGGVELTPLRALITFIFSHPYQNKTGEVTEKMKSRLFSERLQDLQSMFNIEKPEGVMTTMCDTFPMEHNELQNALTTAIEYQNNVKKNRTRLIQKGQLILDHIEQSNLSTPDSAAAGPSVGGLLSAPGYF